VGICRLLVWGASGLTLLVVVDFTVGSNPFSQPSIQLIANCHHTVPLSAQACRKSEGAGQNLALPLKPQFDAYRLTERAIERKASDLMAAGYGRAGGRLPQGPHQPLAAARSRICTSCGPWQNSGCIHAAMHPREPHRATKRAAGTPPPAALLLPEILPHMPGRAVPAGRLAALRCGAGVSPRGLLGQECTDSVSPGCSVVLRRRRFQNVANSWLASALEQWSKARARLAQCLRVQVCCVSHVVVQPARRPSGSRPC
jgi:hypothetical protein